MQRLFSAFPPGWPGIGLLLLRISVAAACLLAYMRCETRAAWVLPTLIAMSACLCAGALTPLVAALAVAVELTVAAKLRVNGAGWSSSRSSMRRRSRCSAPARTRSMRCALAAA